MAKEVYDFSNTYLDCAYCGSIEDDIIADYGCRVRAAPAVVDTPFKKGLPADDDGVPISNPPEID
eukprot:9111850-Alexandrium_andersonii.AAC.1